MKILTTDKKIVNLPVVIQKCGDRDKEGTISIHDYSNCIPANPMSDRGQMVLYEDNSVCNKK